MCVLNDGTVLGASDDGVFKLCCGDDDDGTAINAYFIPLTTDFGTSNRKKCDHAILQYYSDGVMRISIIGDDEDTAGPYSVTAVSTEGRQARMVKTGFGMKFRYGKIKVENYEGSDFTVDKIRLNITSTKRRDF
jgi:hypothetical protein